MQRQQKTRKGLAVCYASNGGDYDRLAMSVWSVRKFIGEDVPIFVFTENHFPPAIYGVTTVCPTKYLWRFGFFAANWCRHTPFASLYRLAIPVADELKEYDRVLYLDTDTLVMSEDARKAIDDIDIGDHEVAGVPDIGSFGDRTPVIVKNDVFPDTVLAMGPYWSKWGTERKRYINAGVVLFNMEAIRRNGDEFYVERMKLFWDIELHGMFGLLDQDVINAFMDVYAGADPRLNVIARAKDDNPLIRHYAGDGKGYQRGDAISLGYRDNIAACRTMEPVGNAHGSRQLALYISHIVNDETIWRCRKLIKDVEGMGIDVIWVYNKKSPGDVEIPKDINYRLLTDEEVLHSRKYIAPADFGMTLQYQAPNYVTMALAKEHPEYDYVWYVEYDVCYSGDWKSFFSRMNDLGHDLICTRVTPRSCDVEWCWWNCSRRVSMWNESFKSVNCMSRLSRKMLDMLEKFYSESEALQPTFFETLWVTMAVNKLSCRDIYRDECVPAYDVFKIRDFSFIVKDKLYHAVKDNIRWRDYIK
jgi:hypothetical protein